MPQTFYVTTSIPYVNAAPHLGHALEFVQADVFARYHRLLGQDTRLLSGTDDNSLKNVLAAERAGVPVRDFVERNAGAFAALAPALDLSTDDFIRTSSDARHLAGVRRLWEVLDRRGDIYKREYEGLYCVDCEQFYPPDELVDGCCPEHGTRPEVVQEENYFFRLSRYGEVLAQLLDSGRLRIVPQSRRNEVRAFVAGGLSDFSISRSRRRARGWGIAVPGDAEQVMYVWFDALANYITALGYGNPDQRLYRRYWMSDDARVHVIGKGILRFHAVYWPAMLLAAGEPLPDTIFVHGYLTIGGTKISKSLGNVVDPLSCVARFGTDAVRYWLLRAVSPTEDADYTDEKLGRRYTADLANDLGNLLQRTVSMVHRYRGGIVPATPEVSVVADVPESAAGAGSEAQMAALAGAVVQRLHDAVEAFDPQAALVAIWELVTRANRYVEERAPWTLARAERAGDAGAGSRLDGVLFTLTETLRLVGEALRPFLPGTAAGILTQLGVDPAADWRSGLRWGALAPGLALGPAQPLFPRLASIDPTEVGAVAAPAAAVTPDGRGDRPAGYTPCPGMTE
jgi:methionyl-tRNA synthetase